MRSASPSLFIDVSRIESLGGRVRAPVEPAFAIQARFKHIRGVPARGDGIPLFKLQVLDSLIDRLLAVRDGKGVLSGISAPPAGPLDPVLASLEHQLRESLLRIRPAFGGRYPETGMLVDLAA